MIAEQIDLSDRSQKKIPEDARVLTSARSVRNRVPAADAKALGTTETRAFPKWARRRREAQERTEKHRASEGCLMIRRYGSLRACRRDQHKVFWPSDLAPHPGRRRSKDPNGMPFNCPITLPSARRTMSIKTNMAMRTASAK